MMGLVALLVAALLGGCSTLRATPPVTPLPSDASPDSSPETSMRASGANTVMKPSQSFVSMQRK